MTLSSNSPQTQQSLYPQIAPHHLIEWLESSVDEQLIALNLLSLKDFEPQDHLFYGLPNSERRNDGRVKPTWLYRYAHTESGGWWVSGLDPHNNWQRMTWGRFKPDVPRIDENKGKSIRYESPPKVSSHLTYFDIPPHIWDKVAKRYRIKRYYSPLALRLVDKPLQKSSGVYALTSTGEQQSLSDCLRDGIKPAFLPKNLRPHRHLTLRRATAQSCPPQSQPTAHPEYPSPYCFWEWVKKHPEIPIILTEGEKKAACLLSLGFVAIALPGIWMGRVGTKEQEELHPDLLPMVQPGRKFIILFDNDKKPSTRKAVHHATIRQGQAIEAAGAECEVATLTGKEKGVDDFVTAHGKQAKALIKQIIEAALSFKDYLRQSRARSWGLSSKYPPNIILNTRYLSDAVLLPTSGLVILASGMGTGKTELLARFRALYPQERFLNLGHRVNLMKNLSERLHTEMYSELSQGELAKAVALSITVDSLYKLETELNEYGCVFIDEACQNLAHLLHSNTCKDHRAEILEVLEYIIRRAKLVVLADAHMNDVTVNFFRAMRPEDEVPFIIKNEYKQAGREVYFYEGEDNSALVAKISTALMLGLKIMVVSDSKKFIKKLETAMTVEVDEDKSLFEPDELNSPGNNKLRIWSIHAENSGSEENKAFIKDISQEVKNLDALLASPSLGTGVDICDYHFDAVFGAFHAVSQSATECAQSLHRYRHQVPLHIWVAPRPPFGYKETFDWKIKERMLELNEMTAFLIRIDRENGKRGAEKDWALDAYCEIEAQRNDSINNLRDDLKTLLEEMAYNINIVESETDAMVANKLKAASQYLDAAHRLAVVQASNISPQEYLARQAKEYLPPEEIVECEKYRLQRDYGMPVTEELVKRDAGGQLISQLIALESLLAPSEGEIVDPETGRKYPAPPKIVTEKDLRERENLPLCMDWHNYSSKWLARHALGLPKILDRLMAGEEICATDPDVVKMTRIAMASSVHVKAILNLTIPKDCQPLWLMGLLLNQVGLRTASRKKGGRGQQVTYRSLAIEDLAFAVEVLQYRERQRREKAGREQEFQENAQKHQAKMQSLYGIEPPPPTVSTPPDKRDINTLEGGVNTDNKEPKMVNVPSENRLEKLQPALLLLEGTIENGLTVIKEIVRSSLYRNQISNRVLHWLSKPINFLPIDLSKG